MFVLGIIAIALCTRLSEAATPQLYCPASYDLTVAYGNSVGLFDQGWSIYGGGGAATKTSFNLVGGYVEFDIDFSSSHTGSCQTIYTVSPSLGDSGFSQSNYCDGFAANGFCVEVDWLESNGACGGQQSLHSVAPGQTGCSQTTGGCTNSFRYTSNSFHMRVEYDSTGRWTNIHDGISVGPLQMSPKPVDSDWVAVSNAYSTNGAVIYSSQWQGWVPFSSCSVNPGSLDSSSFTIKNLVVYGSVVKGPTPRVCTAKLLAMSNSSSFLHL